jgi:hypothetical protein
MEVAMAKRIDLEKTLLRNKNINRDQYQEAFEIITSLRERGILKRPSYSLPPPFSESPMQKMQTTTQD